jgi:8-oxo-dGTP diphosphatase
MSIFNIRVYGLLINDNHEVLVTDEFRFGKEILKFPGGGLNWGEGTLDCLKREFKEELGCEIEIIKHFYTTDFFQPSAFDASQQLISIYYLVKAPALKESNPSVLFKEKNKQAHPFKDSGAKDAQTFRWLGLKKIDPNEFTFPIDKLVAGMLINHSSPAGK